MKPDSRITTTVVVSLVLSSLAGSALAQPMASGSTWSYTLLEGSQLVDDCPICDRVPIIRPMRGTFQLRLVQQNPIFTNYAIENVSLVAGDINPPTYKIIGEGTYRVGGEIALQQDLFLKLTIDDGFVSTVCYLTNALSSVTRLWPMLQGSVDQTNGTATQQFHLDLTAAPFRELWVSTVRGFQAGVWQAPTNSISAGDLISSIGRLAKQNQQLTRQLGIMPPLPDLGLKAVAILAGGETAFSIETEQFSESLGTQLLPGDLLSDRGRIVRTNRELIAAFGPQPPVPADVGLGAAQVMSDGEIYFSVQIGFFSGTLHRVIQPGDLLSSRGAVIKANVDLIARFNPAKSGPSTYGLKAAYTWPSGETWFATEDGFNGSQPPDTYAAGDLLSDQGYVVYRNPEMLSPFRPAGALTTLGLDALFVITDTTTPGPAATNTILASPQFTGQPAASLSLAWTGGGRVFQVERSTNVWGPFLPIGPITTDTSYTDAGALLEHSQGFYRLHQW